MAFRDRIVPEHSKATFPAAKRCLKAKEFTKTLRAIISIDTYSIVDEAWKLAIEAQYHQRVLASPAAGAPLVCQLPGGPSLQIDPQTLESVCV